MRLLLAPILAAATFGALATPVLADGERGRDQYDNRGGGQWDNNRNNGHYDRRDHDRRNWDRRDWDGRDWDRRDFDRRFDNRGRDYWGPSGRPWSHWDNSWGDPNRFARQWGFDRYDYNRGWQRGGTWYSNPSQWSDWGGWSWSFSVGNGGFGNNYGNNYGYHQQNANCATYRTQDWVNGRRAIVTYVGCADRWGQLYEQPGTRRIEQWGW